MRSLAPDADVGIMIGSLVWRRIVLPDGSSVQIDNLPATDARGVVGAQSEGRIICEPSVIIETGRLKRRTDIFVGDERIEIEVSVSALQQFQSFDGCRYVLAIFRLPGEVACRLRRRPLNFCSRVLRSTRCAFRQHDQCARRSGANLKTHHKRARKGLGSRAGRRSVDRPLAAAKDDELGFAGRRRKERGRGRRCAVTARARP
jgi:hypothetical protein